MVQPELNYQQTKLRGLMRKNWTLGGKNMNMTYADTGVNYDEMDPHKRASQLVAATTDHNIKRFGFSVVEWSRGESAFLIETPFCYLGFVVEGLGTKNRVADALYDIANRSQFSSSGFAKVSQCNVAMAVNDLATLGVRPLVYGQYLAIGESAWLTDRTRGDALIEGTRIACELARCTWGGGEIPTLAGIIALETADLAGATFGIIVEKKQVINPAKIKDGDAIVIIESSGVHANGLTLLRKIADKLPEGYLTKIPDGRTYGETLLDPTHIYVGLVEDCLDAGVDIHYAVNITGHGWRKLMRAKQPFMYVIDTLPTQLPIFDFIQKHGPVDDEEAYGNLNMGAGFALYVAEPQAEQVIDIAKKLGQRAFVAGHIEKGDKKVVINPKNLKYSADTLAVR